MYTFATNIKTRRVEVRHDNGLIASYTPGSFELWTIRPDHSLFY